MGMFTACSHTSFFKPVLRDRANDLRGHKNEEAQNPESSKLHTEEIHRTYQSLQGAHVLLAKDN